MYSKHEFYYSDRFNEQDEILDERNETNIKLNGKIIFNLC